MSRPSSNDDSAGRTRDRRFIRPQRRFVANVSKSAEAFFELECVASGRPPIEHDPEKCLAVFPRDKRKAFARRSCSIKNLERDGDSTQSHRARAGVVTR